MSHVVVIFAMSCLSGNGDILDGVNLESLKFYFCLVTEFSTHVHCTT